MIVNKTLIEAAAVCVVLAFDTGAIAGLDLVLAAKRLRNIRPAADKQAGAEPRAAAALDA